MRILKDGVHRAYLNWCHYLGHRFDEETDEKPAFGKRVNQLFKGISEMQVRIPTKDNPDAKPWHYTGLKEKEVVYPCIRAFTPDEDRQAAI